MRSSAAWAPIVRPTYRQRGGDQALWYVEGKWHAGHHSDVGKTACKIFAFDGAWSAEQTSATWKVTVSGGPALTAPEGRVMYRLNRRTACTRMSLCAACSCRASLCSFACAVSPHRLPRREQTQSE